MNSRPLAVLAYTLLRVLIFGAAWVLLVWLTPLDGVYAIVMAILVSGIISIPLLSHQRDLVSVGIAGFFRRMNERIDASTRAEDDPAEDDVPATDIPAQAPTEEPRP